MKFRKKPVEIEAIQFDGEYTSVAELIAGNSGMRWFSESAHGRPPCVEIQTLEGVMTATPGDWIIRGVKGEFYPCKPDIFALTYEPAVSSSSVADSPISSLEVEAVAKFAAMKSGQFTQQAFGDSRVEDAANVLEDVALMLRRLLVSASSASAAADQARP